MSFFNKLPILDQCCGCVTDLKAATAIIAVLGIVTSPALSWAVVRHSYVVRVSCAISSSDTKPDVVDINLNNGLSFGFGANAGLGESCLSTHHAGRNGTEEEDTNTSSISFAESIKYCGWIVLAADIVFLISSISLLSRMYKGPDKFPTMMFLVSGLVSVILTFIYGILYVSACLNVGSVFPFLELLFSFIDLAMWLYFLMVVFSYRRRTT